MNDSGADETEDEVDGDGLEAEKIWKTWGSNSGSRAKWTRRARGQR